MKKEVLTTGPVQTNAYLDHDGRLVVEGVQDVEPILDFNKAQYNEGPQRGDMRKVASIPLVVMAELQRKGIWNDSKKMKAWLNDPENRYFRTSPGRV